METIARRRSRRIESKLSAASRNDGVIASLSPVPGQLKRKSRAKSSSNRNDAVIASISADLPVQFPIENRKTKLCRNRIEDGSASARDGAAAATSLAHVPDDVLMEIFSRVSVKSVFRCRSVCKHLLGILLNPNFIHLHFSRSPISPLLCVNNARSLILQRRSVMWFGLRPEYRSTTSFSLVELLNADSHDSAFTVFKLPQSGNRKPWNREFFTIVNSCNGFLCLRAYSKECSISIYNPVTGEYSILPLLDGFDKEITPRVTVFGLGFSPNTNQYKVLLTVHAHSCPGYIHLDQKCGNKAKTYVPWIYTLGSEAEGWRKVESQPPPSFLSEILNPVFLNGTLHWLVEINHFPIRRDETLIMSFDFESEKFRLLQPPPFFQNPKSLWVDSYRILGGVNGHLYASECLSSDTVNIWVMKEYGLEKSWTEEYVYDISGGGSRKKPPGSGTIPGFSSNWEFLLYFPPKKIICFIDRHQGAIRHVALGDEFIYEVFGYVPSLSSIKTVVGDSVKVLHIR